MSQGAKIRGTYVKWAAGEKKRVEEELKTKRSEVAEKERLVNEARGKLVCLEQLCPCSCSSMQSRSTRLRPRATNR